MKTRDRRSRRGFTLARAMKAVAAIALVIAFLISSFRAYDAPRQSARRASYANNLEQIALAIHAYQGEHGVLPPAHTVDPAGRPLHSWRTLVLPYLEQGPLYDSIDLSKPWDDPANAAARATGLDVFHCRMSDAPPNMTTYLASVGPESALAPDRPRPPDEVIDGFPSTLLLIEAGEEGAVPWMAPVDADEALIVKLGPENRLHHEGDVLAVFLNCVARYLKADTPAEVRRKLITIAGGEVVDLKGL